MKAIFSNPELGNSVLAIMNEALYRIAGEPFSDAQQIAATALRTVHFELQLDGSTEMES